MRTFCILAALTMATTSAYAGSSVSFEIDGHKVRIEAPRNCDQLSCIKVTGFDFKGFKALDDDGEVAVKPDAPAQQAAPAQQLTPAPAAQAAVPQAPVASTAPAATTVASTSPEGTTKTSAVKIEAAPPAPPAAPNSAPLAPAPVQAAATPLGVWATEDNKGSVRIEQCGQNLCGYAVKSGEKILINMKPLDTKWIGHIHDPDSGRNYDSTIAMKGANSLRVQGCAFGGMFCGGQTWNRIS